MLLIVASHFAVHGVRQVLWTHLPECGVWQSASVFNKAVVSVFSCGGTVGVGIFFMLTGCFMAKKNAAPFKLVRLLLQMVFYAVFVLALYAAASCIFHYPFPELRTSTSRFPFQLKLLVQCVIPMTGGTWWFASAYFFLYLLSPVLNYVLRRLNKNGARILILLVFVFWYAPAPFGGAYSGLQRGIFFYLLGAYCALFPKQGESGKKYVCLFAAVFFYLAMSAADFASGFFVGESAAVKIARLFLSEANWCLVPFAVYCLFSFFSRISIQSRVVNTVAATTFGVYLIHDSDVGRAFIWNFIVRPLEHIASPLFALFALASVSSVFSVCSLIDYVRIRLVERKLLPPIQSFYEKFRRKFAAAG